MPRSADPLLVKLIEAVHGEECLWNTRSPLYKDRNKRKDAWNSLASELSIVSGDRAQKHWYNLRTTYGKILTNIRSLNRSGSEANDDTGSNWPYLDLMSFVKDYVVPRTSKNNMDEENFTEEDREPIVKKRKLGKEDVIRSAVSTLNYVREAAGSISREKDNFDVFGSYIASELRSLPPHVAQITKMRFHDILNQAYQESALQQMSTNCTVSTNHINPVSMMQTPLVGESGQGFVIQGRPTGNQPVQVVSPGMMNSTVVQAPYSYRPIPVQVSTPVPNPNPQIPNHGSFLRSVENITDDDE